LERAAEDLGIDLSRSVMVGDSERDLEAGIAAGCTATALVLTGKVSSSDGPVWKQWKTQPDYVAPSLKGAVPWILYVMGASQK
jgi:D-glycero-D-manno-heptose 1,7-bisphosphate phosphatase